MKPTFATAVAALLLGLPAFAQTTGSPNCSTATTITGTGTFPFDSRNAPEGQPDFAACWIERSVWFRWTAPQTGPVVFTTCGMTDMDSAIAVYPGVCGSAKISCNDNAACGIGSTVMFNATAGTQYLLRIGQPDGYWGGSVGQFTVQYNNPPQTSDSCQYATPISTPGLYNYDTTAATSSATDPASCDLMGRDVWFTYTPTESGTANVSTCGLAPFSGMRMAVYQGANACDPSTPLLDCVSYDIYCTQGGAVSLYFNVTAGQTYKVRIGSDRGQTAGAGQFRLVFVPQVTNDECETATNISGTGWFPYTNASATDSTVASDPLNYCGKDVWFRWTAGATGPAYVSTCGRADMNAFIAVFADGCPTAEPLGQNDDDAACGTAARVDFRAVAGQSYLIRIGGVWGYTYTIDGQFEVRNQANGAGGGETVTVTMTGDLVDFGGFRQVSDLPGPDGEVSFREAVMAVNNTPGGQTIGFACDPFFWTYPNAGMAAIIVDFNPFILTDDGTIIDGSTQTAAFGDTNPNGPDVGFFGWQAENTAALYIYGNNCEVRSMNGAQMCGRFAKIYGDNCRIVDCVSIHSLVGNIDIEGGNNNVIGEPGHGNRLNGYNSGVSIIGGSGNKVQSNVISGGFAGVSISGNAAGTLVGGPTLEERNVVLSVGRYVTEGFPTGTYISVGQSTGTVVENNTVGLAADGFTRATGPGTTGIGLSGAVGATVRGNTIAGIRVQGVNHYANRVYGVGMSLTGASDQVIMQGNWIGTDLSGTASYPCLEGFRASPNYVDNTSPNRALFGGTLPEHANLVVNSSQTGVVVGAGQIALRGNSIFNNGLLGIDLVMIDPIFGTTYGVTQNDSLDADTGANGLQNFPVIESAVSNGSQVGISGTLHSHPGESFALEFFANTECDPSGFGEGRDFLGAITVQTDGSGNAPFQAVFQSFTPVGGYITATATRLSQNATSEFSACVVVVGGTVNSCGTTDFDGDGDTGTDADIESFFACLAGNCCPTCWHLGADFDADGDSGTDADIEAFFRVLAGGNC